MKKLLLSIFLSGMILGLYANTDLPGHFRMDVSAQNILVENVQTYFSSWLSLPDQTTFLLTRDTTDKAGYQHLTFQQYHVGKKVDRALVLVHAKDGIVQTVNGDILTKELAAQSNIARRPMPQDNAAIIIRVNGKERLARKVLDFKAAKYKYIDCETGEVLCEQSTIFQLDEVGSASTMYSGVQQMTSYKDGNIYYLKDEGRNIVTVDATHATPIDYTHADNNVDSTFNAYFQSCAQFTNSSSNWEGTYHKYLRHIQIDTLKLTAQDTTPTQLFVKVVKNDQDYSLIYQTGNKNIAQWPMQFDIEDEVEILDVPYWVEIWGCDAAGNNHKIDEVCMGLVYSEIPLDGSSQKTPFSLLFNSEGIQPALDIHWGMQRTIDYYHDVFSRQGHDGHGGLIYQYYNPTQDAQLFSSMPMNAFAQPNANPNFMVYGVGGITYDNNTGTHSAMSMTPLVALDVMAHEFSHLVTEHNGNGGLLYQNESGALNEAFSDIMAMGAMYYVNGNCSWSIGADIMMFASNMRSMSDPWQSAARIQPKYRNGKYWAPLDDLSSTGDNGGVHTNSGIPNHFFYLLVEGGDIHNEVNESYNITGVGMDKGLQIAYLTQLFYLTPEANFDDVRWGTIQAAKELYDDAAILAVKDAWNAVGVYDNTATGIDETNSPSRISSHKAIIHNQLIIEHNGQYFDVLGRPILEL